MIRFPFVACELLICESNTILEAFFMKEDYQGEESIPEIDDSDAGFSENNEDKEQKKEETEAKNTNNSNETVKKSLRDMDFGEFLPNKSNKKKDEEDENDDIVWHNKEDNKEKQEEVKEYQNNIDGTNAESLLDYEIKVQNWDEEKKKKKENKKSKEDEESKKEEKTPIDRFLLLNTFFQLLADDVDVNVTLAGYFNKVFMSFYNKKQKEVSF